MRVTELPKRNQVTIWMKQLLKMHCTTCCLDMVPCWATACRCRVRILLYVFDYVFGNLSFGRPLYRSIPSSSWTKLWAFRSSALLRLWMLVSSAIVVPFQTLTRRSARWAPFLTTSQPQALSRWTHPLSRPCWRRQSYMWSCCCRPVTPARCPSSSWCRFFCFVFFLFFLFFFLCVCVFVFCFVCFVCLFVCLFVCPVYMYICI